MARKLGAVPLGGEESVGQDDIITLVYCQPQACEINIAPMLVKQVTSIGGAPAFRLSSLNGEVVAEGSSGGGIFLNNRLIGNVWQTIMMQCAFPALENGKCRARYTTDNVAAHLPHMLVAHLSQHGVGSGSNKLRVSGPGADAPR
jgi:hypothetical protein